MLSSDFTDFVGESELIMMLWLFFCGCAQGCIDTLPILLNFGLASRTAWLLIKGSALQLALLEYVFTATSLLINLRSSFVAITVFWSPLWSSSNSISWCTIAVMYVVVHPVKDTRMQHPGCVLLVMNHVIRLIQDYGSKKTVMLLSDLTLGPSTDILLWCNSSQLI